MPSKTPPKSKKSFKLLPTLLIVGLVGLLLAGGGFAFAATQEANNSFCASCHTQPESTFYQRSVDAQPVDLASYHNAKKINCIDCHSGDGLGGRLQAELLGAHNALAFYTGTAVQPAVLTQPLGDQNCLKCHQVVTKQTARNNHFHGFLARWQSVDAKAGRCVSCHNGHTTDGTAQNRFQNTVRSRAVCDACHAKLGND
jgi:predicted CXXCH cytochrome family protein